VVGGVVRLGWALSKARVGRGYGVVCDVIFGEGVEAVRGVVAGCEGGHFGGWMVFWGEFDVLGSCAWGCSGAAELLEMKRCR